MREGRRGRRMKKKPRAQAATLPAGCDSKGLPTAVPLAHNSFRRRRRTSGAAAAASEAHSVMHGALFGGGGWGVCSCGATCIPACDTILFSVAARLHTQLLPPANSASSVRTRPLCTRMQPSPSLHARLSAPRLDGHTCVSWTLDRQLAAPPPAWFGRRKKRDADS
jgi:hypothetical protein